MKANHQIGGRSFSFGPFLKCPHPEMVEAVALAGFDFAVADMEHTPIGQRDLYPLVLASERRGMDLVVRIPMKLEMYFKWCLDLNVAYIQVPFVQSREDALEATRLSYFSPAGERGLCRFVRAAEFSARDRNDYLSGANQRTKLILQIEGREGMERIDEILEVDGIDTLFIGPYDLSQSLGRPGQIWDPAVVDAMKGIIATCQAKGVRVGTFTDTPEGVAFWAAAGVQMIQYGSDLHLMMKGASALRAEMTKA